MVTQPAAIVTPAEVSTALGTPLAGLDGRVGTLGVLAGAGPVLVVVVERDCPTSRGALRALAAAGGRVVLVSQGTWEAARDLVSTTGCEDHHAFVEPAPHPVSEALHAATVPTFVLIDEQRMAAHAEGWDRALVASLVERAGGGAISDGGLPELKPGCQSRHTFDAPLQEQLERDDRLLGGDAGSAEELWELGWHDGLPVVPPTTARVRMMLDGRDPAESLGTVGPVKGEVTFERLAACAVLAGCDPSYWPVVEAAARAVLDDRFNSHGVTNTTSFASPWIVVNGPIRHRIGMNGGSNVLGPGSRPNATIGRAIRLLLQLTGGGSPGGLDQSTLGGQHKFTACFPEREEASPWVPLHVSLGHDADSSTVTVLAGEPPAGVTDHQSSSPEQLASTLALGMSHAMSPTLYPISGGQTLLILCTEHAVSFGEAGWSRERLTEFIVTHSRRTIGQLRATGSGVRSGAMEAADDPDTVLDKFRSPDEILIAVTGGDAGRFSAVVAPWGPNSTTVTRVIAD